MIADVPFEVGGVTYTLAFRTLNMKAYERASAGETVFEGFESLEAKPSMTRISALFRAGCSPAVSEEEADAMIDALGLAEVVRLIGAASVEASRGLAAPNPPTPAR